MDSKDLKKVIKASQLDGKDYEGFEYDKKEDVYHTAKPTKNVEVVFGGKEENRLVFLGKKEEVFDEWDEDLDTMTTLRRGFADNEAAFIRKRKTADADNIVELPAGFYEACYDSNRNMCLDKKENINNDDYIDLTESASEDGGLARMEELQDDIETMFDSRDEYKSMDMVHKRGALLYGPPGTGKTFNAIHCAKNTIDDYDAVIITLSRKISPAEFANKFGTALSERNKILLFEEIGQWSVTEKKEALTYLDGKESLNHCYNIATTNFPEQLEDNLVDRPGRFDLLIQFDTPGEEARRQYLEHHLDEESVTDNVIERTQGQSIAHLKEIIVRTKMHDDTSVIDVIDQLKENKQKIEDDFDLTQKAGFEL